MNLPDPCTVRNRIVCGDCLDVLAALPDGGVDLVVTSPPYADARRRAYGGVPPDRYVDWFLPRAEQIRRVLKPAGSFVLNVKERVVGGRRHPYVLRLILALTDQRAGSGRRSTSGTSGTAPPGKWPNRFRHAWERCLHFTRARHFYMDQEAVRVPTGDWARSRLAKLSETDRRRDDSRVGSGFGKNVSNWVGRELAYPSNVLHLPTECGNRGHSAAFPEPLPEFFVRLFSRPGDLVLDPFVGSGTTAAVARRLGRDYLGVDADARYVQRARARVAAVVAAPLPPARPAAAAG